MLYCKLNELQQNTTLCLLVSDLFLLSFGTSWVLSFDPGAME